MRTGGGIDGYRPDASAQPESFPCATAVAAPEQAAGGAGIHDPFVARVRRRRENVAGNDAGVGRPPRPTTVKRLRDAVRRANVDRRRRLRVERDRRGEACTQGAPGASTIGCPEDTFLPGRDIERLRII